MTALVNAGTGLIETDRLILRKFNLDDANDMFKNWINDKDIQSNYDDQYTIFKMLIAFILE